MTSYQDIFQHQAKQIGSQVWLPLYEKPNSWVDQNGNEYSKANGAAADAEQESLDLTTLRSFDAIKAAEEADPLRRLKSSEAFSDDLRQAAISAIERLHRELEWTKRQVRMLDPDDRG